jgi:hypothetical protein
VVVIFPVPKTTGALALPRSTGTARWLTAGVSSAGSGCDTMGATAITVEGPVTKERSGTAIILAASVLAAPGLLTTAFGVMVRLTDLRSSNQFSSF